ncbi:MAG: CDP-alcohol phosphatidyltransferase family protein [Natronomonas sp.]
MTLDKLRPIAEKTLTPFVTAADGVGLSPDSVSIIAFGFAVAAGAVYTLAGNVLEEPLLYALGAGLVFLNGWCDLLDGALARRQGVESRAGDLLDHVLDRYADIVIIAGLAAGVEAYLLGFLAVTGVLMTSYLGTQTQAVGLDRAYGGLVGRADRLAIIGVVTLIAAFYTGAPGGLRLVGWLLVFFAVIGHVTAMQRFYGAMSDLR